MLRLPPTSTLFPNTALRRAYIEMDVPGLSIDDLSVTHERGQIWIRGERKYPQHNQKLWYDERSYGSFQRVVALNESVDPGSIEASLHGGVLFLTLTKKPDHQTHRVEVKSGGPRRLEQT